VQTVQPSPGITTRRGQVRQREQFEDWSTQLRTGLFERARVLTDGSPAPWVARRSTVAQPPNEFGVRLNTPYTLYPHQVHMVRFLQRTEDPEQVALTCYPGPRYGGLLMGDMGTGKTLAIFHLVYATLQQQRQARSTTLFLTKQSLFTNVVDDAFKFFTRRLSLLVYHGHALTTFRGSWSQYDLVLMPLSLFYQGHQIRMGRLLREVQQFQWFRVVVDESHRLANSQTKGFKEVQKLKTQRFHCMTGTPLVNSLKDVHSQLTLTGAKCPPYRGEGAFENFLCTSGLVVRHVHCIMMDELKNVTLPPKVVRDVVYELSDNEKELQQFLIQEARRTSEKSRWLQVLMFLMQTCTAPTLLKSQRHATLPLTYRHLMVRHGPGGTGSTKMQQLRQLVRMEDPRGKIVIMCTWVTPLVLAEEVLRATYGSEHATALVTSTVSEEEQTHALYRHKHDPECRVLLITRDLGAEGLNLNYACTLIWLVPWYSYGGLKQGECRVYRLGQTQETHIYYLIGKDTVEARCLKIARRKAKQAMRFQASAKVDDFLDSCQLQQLIFGDDVEMEAPTVALDPLAPMELEACPIVEDTPPTVPTYLRPYAATS